MDRQLAAWFAREILPHEAALLRYLRRLWPVRDEIPDLMQDIYVKCYEGAADHQPGFAKSYLFTVARHHIVDKVRRNRIVFIDAVSDPNALNVLVDEISPERRVNSHQELKALVQAFGVLPPRCREIVWLRKVAEIPQSEVARRLGLSVRTVEVQVQRGMRTLAKVLLSDVTEPARNEQDESHESAAD